jgi:SAM-dependent methyltransferase
MPFHDDGKTSFDHIYTSPDPRAYFVTLRELDYCIPQLAKPYFVDLIRELRSSSPGRRVRVLDIGCSYGINAALLRCDITMAELYEHYCGADTSAQSPDSLLARDRELVGARDLDPRTRFVGLDVSPEALLYARRAGFLDCGVLADLERGEATPEQREQLAGMDLVISTGCIGYVTERTLAEVIRANADRPPWMAHFVLRMYPFDPVAQCLAELGYHTVRVDQMFKQRRFATAKEQSLVLGTLLELGEDPSGLESDGWLYAQLFISRPHAT